MRSVLVVSYPMDVLGVQLHLKEDRSIPHGARSAAPLFRTTSRRRDDRRQPTDQRKSPFGGGPCPPLRSLASTSRHHLLNKRQDDMLVPSVYAKFPARHDGPMEIPGPSTSARRPSTQQRRGAAPFFPTRAPAGDLRAGPHGTCVQESLDPSALRWGVRKPTLIVRGRVWDGVHVRSPSKSSKANPSEQCIGRVVASRDGRGIV
jgi:hypothetical protein